MSFTAKWKFGPKSPECLSNIQSKETAFSSSRAVVPNLGYPRCSWTAIPRRLQQHLCAPAFMGVAVQEHVGYLRLGTTALVEAAEANLAYLITPSTAGFLTVAVVSATVEFPILPEVDHVYQKFTAGTADKTSWMPEFVIPSPLSIDLSLIHI